MYHVSVNNHANPDFEEEPLTYDDESCAKLPVPSFMKPLSPSRLDCGRRPTALRRAQSSPIRSSKTTTQKEYFGDIPSMAFEDETSFGEGSLELPGVLGKQIHDSKRHKYSGPKQREIVVDTSAEDDFSDEITIFSNLPQSTKSCATSAFNEEVKETVLLSVKSSATSVFEESVCGKETVTTAATDGSSTFLFNQSSMLFPSPAARAKSCLKTERLCADTPTTVKQVSFSRIYMQEYKIIFGDNPSCSDTMPLTLDWSHAPERTWTVDAFESVKEMFPKELATSPASSSSSSSQLVDVSLEKNKSGAATDDVEDQSHSESSHTSSSSKIERNILASILSRQERYELLIRIGGYTRQQVIDCERAFCDQLDYEENQLRTPAVIGTLNSGLISLFRADDDAKARPARGPAVIGKLNLSKLFRKEEPEKEVLHVRNPQTGEVLIVPV